MEGRPGIDTKEDIQAVMMISPDYFRTMDVSLRRGRGFVDADTASTPGVAIVNQKFADVNWPNDEAIGKRVRVFVNRDKKFTPWLTIVGIAPNILQNNVTAHKFDPMLYAPYPP